MNSTSLMLFSQRVFKFLTSNVKKTFSLNVRKTWITQLEFKRALLNSTLESADPECIVLVFVQILITKNTKFSLSMTELHYVGFNGYSQCPTNNDGLPKVIADWTKMVKNEKVKACTHRFVVVEAMEYFEIYGMINNITKPFRVLNKPVLTDNSGSCDEYLIASAGTNIWKYNYSDCEWVECELEFFSKEEKSVWGDSRNKILKFSFQQNPNVIILLNTGSVWLLSGENKLRLLFSNELEKAVDISSGLEHTIILTESGCVFSFGNGSRGQLGLGDLNPTAQPVQISDLEGLKVTKIASGGWHSCAITDSGDLYTWGWNNFGQLSAFENAEEIGLSALPVFVEVGEDPELKVVDMACGRRHTVAVLENGDLYSTGWNVYNQLGIAKTCEKVTKFTKCEIDRCQNRKVICGPWYTILLKEPV